ncbi:MAG: 2OG-Fe(II) oxygenase [Desmonostoc vinosum HA7617-LM4]|jgi:hypothetical protein|nr:2OG-Fe(II) oxygenase [Desmonostoc vinosum HA7617-LM4]
MAHVINPIVYEKAKDWASIYHAAKPFPHVVIDNFLDESLAENLLKCFPEISQMSRSHHYLFTNKYDLGIRQHISTYFNELYQELISHQLRFFLKELVGENLFVDPELCGDIHLGLNGSFLDMHTDFNLHPSKDNWLHCLNIIIYLSKDWKEEFGGQLLLKSNLEGFATQIFPKFNRSVIMQSNDTTYHGYSQLKLPETLTRQSIIFPIYKEESLDKIPPRHLTMFTPDQGSELKLQLAKIYNFITILKARIKRQISKKS